MKILKCKKALSPSMRCQSAIFAMIGITTPTVLLGWFILIFAISITMATWVGSILVRRKAKCDVKGCNRKAEVFGETLKFCRGHWDKICGEKDAEVFEEEKD
jgi:hypothetical protein